VGGEDCVAVLPEPVAGDAGDADESVVWREKVAELSARGFRLRHLLDFCQSLGNPAVMPHFDATISKTNDVVRQAVIPMSRLSGAWREVQTGRAGTMLPAGQALATRMQDRVPLKAQIMVTHNWDNLFAHLVAAVVAHALGERTFEEVRTMMGQPNGLEKLRRRAANHDTLDMARRIPTRYNLRSVEVLWICAFSINQHASICGGFGPQPAVGTPAFEAFDAKRRDTVTGLIFQVCPCSTEKHFNGHKDVCELNKFDSMMRNLSLAPTSFFKHVVALDDQLDLFNRAWCVAELVEGRRLNLPQVLIIRNVACLPRSKAAALRKIRVQDCQASRAEDVKEILAKIDDKDQFNRELQAALFQGRGSLLGDLQRNLDEVARADLQAALLDLLVV